MKTVFARWLTPLALLAAAIPAHYVHAYQPYGYYDYGQAQPYYQQVPYQQPYQQQPYQQPYGQPYWTPYQQQTQQPQAQQHYQPPRVEISVSDTAPYEQQSLVYKIRVISSGNLKTVAPELPQTSDVVLRTLGDPVTESEKKDNPQEIVTEYRYLLMPLSSGLVTVPAARVTGRYSATGGGDGPAFEVSGDPVVMRVRPASDAVQPWLPLYSLQINARVRGNEAPAAGNPIELEVETKAVGATGSQIPSIANHLSSDEFRIYPGKTVTDGRIAGDGKTLLGRRVEHFTLVPQFGGWLNLPNVSINWWNVRYNRPEVAALLTDQLNVMGPANPANSGFGDSGAGPLSSWLFWLPVLAAVAIVSFGWISAFLGDGTLPGTQRLRKLVQPALGELYAPIAALASRISPRRSLHRLRAWTGRHLPVSWKLWFCLRAISHEDDPAEWGQALQILAAKHLGVRPHSNLIYLGHSIVACHPRANAEQVEQLMAELDEAVYGDRPIQSFSRWKREFRDQIKPSLLTMQFRPCGTERRRPRELPKLNPL